MCSAHRLTNRNISVKFHENRSKSSGDIEWTRNSRVNPLTLTCDLQSRELGHTYERSFMKIDQRVQEIWSGHKIKGLNPLTLSLGS